MARSSSWMQTGTGYTQVPDDEDTSHPLPSPPKLKKHRQIFKADRRSFFCCATILIIVFLIIAPRWHRSSSDGRTPAGTARPILQLPEGSCGSVQQGYQCRPELSHLWGQYSPYFRVPSDIDDVVPSGCSITFAQVLSRHGARDPTDHKWEQYRETVSKIQKQVHSFTGKYEFLNDYKYSLGVDQLSAFGAKELVNSGVEFYERYRDGLTKSNTPFIRASGQQRVIDSATNWTQGFHFAKSEDSDHSAPDPYPYEVVIVSEEKGSNNTLNGGLCDAYRKVQTDLEAQKEWESVFVPPIAARLSHDLSDMSLEKQEVVDLMQLCAFETVATVDAEVSPFCYLFSEQEFQELNHYESLDKYYGCSYGHYLGPTQGVGFVNELIARLTKSPVVDHTTVNHTLDNNPKTFPLGPGDNLFADFSHDNDMVSIMSALGLYKDTPPLSNRSMDSIEYTKGFSAAWVVPFAARTYIEKMACANNDEELVRIIVNGRVMPLNTCGGDRLGRCKLSAFLESLSFARQGGRWDECFV